MSIYPELPSSTYREIDGKRYFVRKFGLNGQVLEEEHVPMPAEKIIRFMKEDGTEDVDKRKTKRLEEN